jgi:methionyl-tRNA synthetase
LPQDDALAKEAQGAIGEVLERYDKFEFARALEAIWSVIAAADKYLTTEQPWALEDSSDEQERKATILWTTAEVLRIVCALACPVLPESTAKVWKMLGYSTAIGTTELDGLHWGQLVPGVSLGKFQALFPRVEKAEAIERIEAMANEELNPAKAAEATTPAAHTPAGAAAAPAAGPAEKIGIEDFTKVEMRVGQVKTAERIVGADKLLKLTVDIGSEIRQICAGIAQYYEPESLIGRKVVVVVNLAPRKLRGVESNGMIVAASVGPEGRPVLAGFHEEVEIGARLK